MNERSSNHPPSRSDGGARLYAVLETQPWSDVIQVCSVPLRLTESLVNELQDQFALKTDVDEFRRGLEEFNLVTLRDEDEWRLDLEVRQYFLDRLERENPGLAQRVHAAVLSHLESTTYPAMGEDEIQLHRAYHTTPSSPDAGADLYWSTYCRIRASNRFAMLPVLARLAESQAHWLKNYEQDIRLYLAVALYFEGPVESKQRASDILAEVLEQGGASASLITDASFLLATLKEQVNRGEAIKLYEQATKLRDSLDLRDKDPDVQHHLRLTLAKSFFNLASILQTKGDPEALEKAEFYYRHGIQIVSGIDPGYEATQLRHLVGLLQKRGEKDQVEGPIQRISQIEDPFRRAFLEDAFSKPGDIGYLYYAISALNHGWGYDSQLVRIEVEQNGATWLEGTYTLRATSVLGQTDFYLETVPESEAGVHFESLESLTPEFTLDYGRLDVDNPEIERLEMTIDPPIQPGNQLTYRWTARSSPGTVATTPEQLEETRLDYEYAFWDITVPIRRLVIQVTIPWEQKRPTPPAWFEVWTVGRWHAQTQAQTAYRAFLEDSPGRVRVHVEKRSPDKVQLGLEVSYPWLAMRYVLAWGLK
jgi:tetratricopeptide (TPR) repeat protein